MRVSWVLLLTAIAALGVVGGYATVCVYGPVREVAIGTPIRHDDFFFTMTNVARSGGAHYDVTVLVQNRARRVDYEWRDTIAYVQVGGGKRYAPVSDARFIIGPGVSREAHVAFELPAGAKDVDLRFWDGIFMGDAFDAAAYSRTAVRLTT